MAESGIQANDTRFRRSLKIGLVCASTVLSCGCCCPLRPECLPAEPRASAAAVDAPAGVTEVEASQARAAARALAAADTWDTQSWRKAARELRGAGNAGVFELRDLLQSGCDEYIGKALWVAVGWAEGAGALREDIGSVLRTRPLHADAASEALLRAGEPGVIQLIQSMSAASDVVRREVATRLADAATSVRYRSLPGFAAAMRVALGDEVPDVRSAAAYALARLRGGPEAALDELLPMLQDPDPSVRVAVTTLLSTECGRRASVAAALDALLDDPHDAVLQTVLQVFAQTHVQVSQATEKMAAILGTHEMGGVRAAAAEALGTQGNAPVPALYDALRDSQPCVRGAAVRSLAGLSGASGGDFLPRAVRLLGDPAEAVRLAALEGLAAHAWRSADVAHAVLVSGVLGEMNPQVRVAALRALKANGVFNAEVAEALERLSLDPDSLVRDAAADARRALSGM